jgi:hypothetical protein
METQALNVNGVNVPEYVTAGRMDPAVKVAWLEGLRGGSYRQLREGFYDGRCHCCLAVLARRLLLPDEQLDLDDDDETVLCELEVNGGLNMIGLERAGLSMAQQQFLISLNDLHAWTFEEIADFVEAYL